VVFGIAVLAIGKAAPELAFFVVLALVVFLAWWVYRGWGRIDR
jgi:hypothetical protein